MIKMIFKINYFIKIFMFISVIDKFNMVMKINHYKSNIRKIHDYKKLYNDYTKNIVEDYFYKEIQYFNFKF